jgi:pimeloyl-ACP methyl ester carboxylesterase
MSEPGKAKRTLRWWVIRLTPAAIAIVAAPIVMVSCSMPGPKSDPARIAALTRETTTDGPESEHVSYLRAGDEHQPRVIYIHGTPGAASDFADFLVTPVPGLEAVAVDRLGFGKSGHHSGGEDSFDAQAKALAPLLVQRDGKWPILVGHSLGGPIAARLAAMYPDRVSGLVIAAGSLDPEQEKPGFGQRLFTSDAIRWLLPQTLDNTAGELKAAKTQTELLAAELKNITCSVIIIHGTADDQVPYANMAYSKKMLINASSVETVTIDRQNHFIPWQRPETIRDAVKKLSEHR